MKPSPVQLLQSTIDKISVEVNEDFTGVGEGQIWAEDITLQVREQVEQASDYWDGRDVPPVPEIRGRTYVITLGVRTDPKEKTQAPYSFEILASGLVVCMVERIGEMEPDEAAKQYGLSMIYGAMREQLLILTSRMIHGPRLLPTVSFMEPPRASKNGAVKAKQKAAEDPLNLGRSALLSRD